MKNGKKILLITACAVLLVVASVMGTLAYLTDSESVKNTFTVGSVGLSLDEAKVDKMGVSQGSRWQPSEQDSAQEYHLLPGHTYVKDPTVTVDTGSEESYVRMIVTVNFAEALTDAELATNLDNIFTGYEKTTWVRHSRTVAADSKSIVYEYRYFETVDGTDGKLPALFSGFTVPGTYTNEQIAALDEMTIDVVAHAIQAEGFADADAAWAEFKP